MTRRQLWRATYIKFHKFLEHWLCEGRIIEDMVWFGAHFCVNALASKSWQVWLLSLRARIPVTLLTMRQNQVIILNLANLEHATGPSLCRPLVPILTSRSRGQYRWEMLLVHHLVEADWGINLMVYVDECFQSGFVGLWGCIRPVADNILYGGSRCRLPIA